MLLRRRAAVLCRSVVVARKMLMQERMIARIHQPTTTQSASMQEDALPAGRQRASVPVMVLCVIAVLAAVYVARDLLVPLAFAALLTLLLRPLLRRMQRLRIPNMLSAFLLIGIVAVVFAGGLLLLAGQAQHWLAEAPQTIQQVGQMLPQKIGPLEHLRKMSAAVENITEDKNVEQPLHVIVQSSGAATKILGVSGHFLGASVIVFVVGYFLLAFSDTLLAQAIGLRSRFNEKRNIVELLRNVEGGISRYLLTITVVNVGLGIATGLAMWALGIPNPILWGVMAATLNYVPHIGAMLCMAVLFFVGAVSHESLAYGTAVSGVFLLLTSAESYFITPLVLSKSLQLSPLAVILAILFCGWMWGIAGGLMAAPLLTIVKLVCDQFESLHPVAAFLAGGGSTNGNGAHAASMD